MEPDPTQMKPGYVTTEFWLTVGHSVLNFVALLLAVLHPGFSINPDVQKLIEMVAPLAASLGVIFYGYSRAHVKAAALRAAVDLRGIEVNRTLTLEQQNNERSATEAHISLQREISLPVKPPARTATARRSRSGVKGG